MTDDAIERGPAEDVFTPWLDRGNRLLAELGLSWSSILDFKSISYTTGVTPARVHARLAGLPPRAERQRFAERLRFLCETRRDPRGKKYSLRSIAAGVDFKLTASAVSHLLNGRNEPGRDTAARLERFFKVPVGWCSLSESEALVLAISPVLERMEGAKNAVHAVAAELQAHGVVSVEARSTGQVSQDPDLLRQLMPTVLSALAEVRAAEGDKPGAPRRQA
ncbi:hypothetical protein ACFWY6_41835 [Streptomyces sp. NPDC059037]|uniref:hypothetical protein n=1 Tax=Streptomyces sp. NPDC059037 TaxID=3346710 RepID=UPI0036CD08B1